MISIIWDLFDKDNGHFCNILMDVAGGFLYIIKLSITHKKLYGSLLYV